MNYGGWQLATQTRGDSAVSFLQQTKVENIENIEIVVPNCIQMGRCDSPEIFCEASETDTLFQQVKVT